MEWQTEESTFAVQTVLALFDECIAVFEEIAEETDQLISIVGNIPPGKGRNP